MKLATLVIFAALLACKQEPSRASPVDAGGPWSPSPDVVTLGRLRRDPNAIPPRSTNDRPASTLRSYRVDGWLGFSTTQSKTDADSWAAHLSNPSRGVCDGARFAPQIRVLRVDLGHYSRLEGGPLDGLLVQAIEHHHRPGRPCDIAVATDAYARANKWPIALNAPPGAGTDQNKLDPR